MTNPPPGARCLDERAAVRLASHRSRQRPPQAPEPQPTKAQPARISDRVRRLDASGIRRVFDLAASLKNPVDLSIGQPDHDVPEPVKESAIRAIRAGRNRYTPTQGDPALVAALKQHLARSVPVDGRSVLITSGVSGGLFLAFAALLNPGDEVVIPDPYFVIYKQVPSFLGAVPVLVDTYPDFHLTAERVAPHITSRTRVLVIGSPGNPTGAIATESELRDLADLARRHDLVVVTDEIYRTFSYDGPAPSIAPLYENTLLLGGFSKSHAAPGWRIGHALGPTELINEMAKLQQYSFVCAPAPAQAAILENLELDTAAVADAYRRKRDLICDGLAGRFEFVRPAGAFYVFPKAPWGDGDRFVEAAIRNNLLIIPGSVFSGRNTHFRISFAASDETIRRGVEILNRLAAQPQ